MPLSLLILALSAFAIGTTEFVIMGLLPDVAADLGVSIPGAGWLVTGYALGVAIGAPLAWVAWRGGTTIRIDSGSGALIVAGLLVGLGTRIGGGCTSGHGVCGTARLSPRSLVATGLFMAAGMAVVALVRHGVAA